MAAKRSLGIDVAQILHNGASATSVGRPGGHPTRVADDQIAATAAVSGFIILNEDISLFVAADEPVSNR